MTGAATRTISVLTAVLPARSDHLDAAWASLVAQQLPDSWDLQWCVQLDGPGTLVANLAQDRRISAERSPRAAGPAIARTLCLGRARGELVVVLDADDELTPGALSRAVTVLGDHPDVHWVTSAALDLHPDGSTVAAATDPPPGRLPAGTLGAAWSRDGHRLPVHPATLCSRTDSVLALGGWMALPASEDTGLLLALDALWPGWFIADPGLYYRRWPAQLTESPVHSVALERDSREAVIEARLRAMHALRTDRAPAARTS